MTHFPYFQCIFLISFSTMHLAYLLDTKPLSQNAENMMEIFNELFIMMFCHILTNLLRIEIFEVLKSSFGWMLIMFIMVNVFVNLSYVVY